MASGHSKTSAAFLLASPMIVEPPNPGQANQNYQQNWEGAITHQISLELPISLCVLLLGPACMTLEDFSKSFLSERPAEVELMNVQSQ